MERSKTDPKCYFSQIFVKVSSPDRDVRTSLTKHRQPLAYFTTFASSGMENPSFASLSIDFH